MIVAVHQPNYAPWLGYFHKLAHADHFVFLDDVQYSKNSYINRAQIDAGGRARWLTVPVSFAFGDPIAAVRFARADWRAAHLNTMKTFYAAAPAFRAVWPRLCDIYAGLPQDDLARSNAALIRALADELGLKPRYHLASALGFAGLRADARLARIVAALAPGGTYLSGRGGADYQSEATYAAAGIALRYADFRPAAYPQGRADFLAGLSTLDAVFRLGWSGTAALLAQPGPERDAA